MIKNILVAAPLYPPEIGGPATYVRMLEEHLPAEGFSLSVVPFAQVRSHPKVLRHLAYVFLLLRQSKGKDMIYALDPVSVGVPAYLVSALTRKPLWVRLGGDYAWEQGQQRFSLTASLDAYTADKTQATLPVRVLAFVQGFVTRQAGQVIVPSVYMKKIVETWGVAQSKLAVVYSALEPLPVPLDKKDYRRTFGFTGPVVLSAGRLVPWKGFSALISAVQGLREQYPDIQLYIAGDGPQKGELHEQIAHAGLSEVVHLLGRVPKSELGKYIAAADVFVLNTTYEGLSHQLLEVMALGTPVVATDVGGNPELIVDGESGYLIAPDDVGRLSECIHTLISDASLCDRFTKRAQQRTEAFGATTAIQSLSALLRSYT